MLTGQIAAIAAFSVLGAGISAFAGYRSRVLWPTVTAFVVTWIAAMVLYSTAGLYAPDAFTYNAVAESLSEGGSPFISAGKEGWPYLLAGIYSMFGPLPQLGLVVSVTLSAIIVPLLASTARLTGLPVVPTAWITALFPFIIVWSAMLLRESATWVLLALCLWGAAGLAAETWIRWAHGLALVAGLVLLTWARGPAALIIGAALLPALLIVMGRRGILPLSASVAGGGLLLLIEPVRARLMAILGRNSLDTIDAARESLSSDALTAWPKNGDTIHVIADALPRVALGPYPWEWGYLPLPLVADAVAWLSILALAAIGLVVMKNRKISLLLLAPALALLASLTITSGNYGTMQRLRVQAVIFLIPLAAEGLKWVFGRVRRPCMLDAEESEALPSTEHDSALQE